MKSPGENQTFSVFNQTKRRRTQIQEKARYDHVEIFILRPNGEKTLLTKTQIFGAQAKRRQQSAALAFFLRIGGCGSSVVKCPLGGEAVFN